MEKELAKINDLIKEFNKSDFKFELELRITNKVDKHYLKLEQIMQIVCRASGLTPEYLNMKTREPEILIPRQICHYIGEKYSKKSLNEVGFYFGGKDHATVLNSKKKIQNLLDTDFEFREKWNPVINNCHSLYLYGT